MDKGRAGWRIWAVALLAAALGILSVLRLEGARAGLEITDLRLGETPVTRYRLPDSIGPAVVVAHGFAGSRQLMEAYALTLARAGYQVMSFDFEGHGRHRRPMSGDPEAIEGTTSRLVAQTRSVLDAAATQDGAAGADLALLGHSMASDVIVRAAAQDPRVGPVIGISAFSNAITPGAPDNLLLVTGQFEPGLREAALGYMRQIAPDAAEGEVVQGAGGVRRQAVVAPGVEHVGVLYSGTGLAAAQGWLDAYYGRASPAAAPALTGGWIALLLAAAVALAWPLSRLLPAGTPPPVLPRALFWRALLLPAIATPLLLSLFETRILPILVADYLALHFLVFGVAVLAILRLGGQGSGRFDLLAALVLLIYGLGVFGFLLDRYAASFMPHSGRLVIILAVALGAVPFMLADARLTEAGRAPVLRRLAVRAAVLGSLAFAVALDFERLFFLIMILPVILLFYLVFGTMGGWVGRRTGASAAIGLALGLILAWAIGVSFPLFSA